MERSASEVAQVLRYAHSRAVAENTGMLWRWNAQERKGALYSVTPDGTESAIADRFTAFQPVLPAVTVAFTGPDGPIDEVVFYPDGTAGAASFVLTHGSRTYTVKVDAATSQVLFTAGAASR